MHSSLELVVGDVTAQQVDALVTATGIGPRGQSSVELAIRRRAGLGLEEAYAQLVEPFEGALPTEAAVVTEGFALRARYVIHCRPPSYESKHVPRCVASLARTVQQALHEVSALCAGSVAFASLGTGAYGFPANIAAPTVLAEVFEWLAQCEAPRRARIVTTGPGMITTYAQSAMRVLPSFRPSPLAEGGLRIELTRDSSAA